MKESVKKVIFIEPYSCEDLIGYTIIEIIDTGPTLDELSTWHKLMKIELGGFSKIDKEEETL
jgi:hypothetical protein